MLILVHFLNHYRSGASSLPGTADVDTALRDSRGRSCCDLPLFETFGLDFLTQVTLIESGALNISRILKWTLLKLLIVFQVPLPEIGIFHMLNLILLLLYQLIDDLERILFSNLR